MFHSCKDTKFFRIVSHIGTDKYELQSQVFPVLGIKLWVRAVKRGKWEDSMSGYPSLGVVVMQVIDIPKKLFILLLREVCEELSLLLR